MKECRTIQRRKVWRGDVGVRNGHENWALWNATNSPPTFFNQALQSYFGGKMSSNYIICLNCNETTIKNHERKMDLKMVGTISQGVSFFFEGKILSLPPFLTRGQDRFYSLSLHKCAPFHIFWWLNATEFLPRNCEGIFGNKFLVFSWISNPSEQQIGVRLPYF